MICVREEPVWIENILSSSVSILKLSFSGLFKWMYSEMDVNWLAWLVVASLGKYVDYFAVQWTALARYMHYVWRLNITGFQSVNFIIVPNELKCSLQALIHVTLA